MQMRSLIQEFKVSYRYPVLFTHSLFKIENESLIEALRYDDNPLPKKVFFIVDEGVVKFHTKLLVEIKAYTEAHSNWLYSTAEPLVIMGGEECKNKPGLVELIQQAVNDHKIDRHSYIVAIGGGAMLDMVGFAAAISHRGIRLVRVPTTVLSQNDSGIGVKNSVNAFKKKNFLGTFAPPFAVINDFDFLTTLEDRDWRAGIAEAIKVALIKDKEFFNFIRDNVDGFVERKMAPMEQQIYRCAELHLNHIAGGDPFEMGSSRPLDFGHWAAHKLEQLTEFSVRHGEAVAIGIALDCIYSNLVGMLSKAELDEIIQVINGLGFDLYHPKLSSFHTDPDHPKSIFRGLTEFREHLGGKLTIMLLEGIGIGKEVHEVDLTIMSKAIKMLESIQNKEVAF